MRISLSLKKLFLKYFSVKLLKQRINAFNIITAENKFIIIYNFIFLIIFKILKKYLNFTGYLRKYIFKYI